MLKNQKGAALLQVLLITVVLAGMATMLLRASLSRTSGARQTRRSVSSQLYINACMAEVNTFWTLKSPEAYARDMQACIMHCADGAVSDGNGAISSCADAKKVKSYTCENGVVAEFIENLPATGRCRLEYKIPTNSNLAHL